MGMVLARELALIPLERNTIPHPGLPLEGEGENSKRRVVHTRNRTA